MHTFADLPSFSPKKGLLHTINHIRDEDNFRFANLVRLSDFSPPSSPNQGEIISQSAQKRKRDEESEYLTPFGRRRLSNGSFQQEKHPQIFPVDDAVNELSLHFTDDNLPLKHLSLPSTPTKRKILHPQATGTPKVHLESSDFSQKRPENPPTLPGFTPAKPIFSFLSSTPKSTPSISLPSSNRTPLTTSTIKPPTDTIPLSSQGRTQKSFTMTDDVELIDLSDDTLKFIRQIQPIQRNQDAFREDCQKMQKKMQLLIENYKALKERIPDLLKVPTPVESERQRLVLLSPEQDEVVDSIFSRDDSDLIASGWNIEIKTSDLACLQPRGWLNDEVINFYFNMIAQTSQERETCKCHTFNTFFYTCLTKKGYEYSRVRKWTKNVDLFTLDKVFIPIHVGGVHWCLAVINLKDELFQYYDSMGGVNVECLNNLRRYLADESKNKQGKGVEGLDRWQDQYPEDIPHQANGYDCGVFVCQFTKSLACGFGSGNFPFSQKEMPLIRRAMVWEIYKKELLLGE